MQLQSSDPEVFEKLDATTLTNTLVNPDAGDEAHRAALTALSHRGPMERNPRLVQVLGSILRSPGRWAPDIPEKIIDLFATDPDPEATVAMLEVLPIMLDRERSTATTGGLSTVRGYFYTALATRERDEDIAVWSEFLPKLNARLLVNIILDPQAGPLTEAIGPFELLDRQPEPERTNGIFEVLLGATRGGTINESVREAFALLKHGAHRQTYMDGIETLADHWERAKQSGHSQHVKGLQAVLAVMDKKPRSPAERLTGKRPWAP
jgi:hypothetical protein